MSAIETLSYILLGITLASLIVFHWSQDEHRRNVAVWAGLVSGSALTALLALVGVYVLVVQ